MVEFKKKIDSDWKRKAAQEKAALKAKRAMKEKANNEESSAPQFMDLVKTLAIQVQMALGAPDPHTGQRQANPEAARYAIGLLDVLKTKTAGNLEPNEEQDLETLINELKMVFMRVMGNA